jgi:hypothetical protein
MEELVKIFLSFGDAIFTDVSIESVLSFKKKWNSMRDILEERPFSVLKLQTHMTVYLGFLNSNSGTLKKRNSIRENSKKFGIPLEKIDENAMSKEHNSSAPMYTRRMSINRSSSGEKAEKKKIEAYSSVEDTIGKIINLLIALNLLKINLIDL